MRENAKRNFREVVKVKKVAVIYWSGIGNTEKMAEELRKGARMEALMLIYCLLVRFL